MPQMWNEDKPSQLELDKLIEEIKAMIDKFGLPVELVDRLVPEPEKIVIGGCSRCTICPCMICW
jgi:hypothetical protein